MLKLDVRTDANRIRAQVQLDAREYATAAVRALNYTAESTRTAATRKLQERYNLAYQRFRREAFYVRKATRQTLTSIVGTSGRPLPLYLFSARQTKVGVSVSVRKGRRKTIPHAFIARMPSGHMGVFTRRDKKRLPIDERYTVSVPGMMQTKEVDQALKSLAGGFFVREFDRQSRLLVGKRNG